MDLLQLGSFIGAALAAGYAVWGNRKVDGVHGNVREQLKTASDESSLKLEKVKTQQEEMQRTLGEIKRDIDRAIDEARRSQSELAARLEQRIAGMDTQLRQCVTDEEFKTYVAASNGHITTLSEKVGRAAGILETFRRD